MSTSALKKYKSVPIYVVENHNEVLPFIYRNIGSRHLALNDNVIIHFDSHPDLSIPRTMPASTVLDKYELFENISIESWILPAAFSGHIKNIVWIKPHWANQIPEGFHKFMIGENTDGTIAVNSSLDYFVSEGVYNNELKGRTQEVALEIVTLDENVIMSNITKYIDTTYILDIDLDYFSTHNPFKIMYSKGDVYEKLKEIFFYSKPKSNLPGDILQTVIERSNLLNELEKLFNYLEDHRNLNNWPDKASLNLKKVEDLKKYVLEYYEDESIDWTIMFNAGCTWDDPEIILPHHETSDFELKEMYKVFEKFITLLPVPPTIITISRSSEDDYCPQHQVEQIQETVIHILKTTFNVSEPVLEYLQNNE